MIKHNGMRPQDIAVLLKMIQKENEDLRMIDISKELIISAGEVSESLKRSVIAGLISPDKKSIMKMALLEFLQYGLKYVYPANPGPVVRGVPTAHSAPPLSDKISSTEDYVLRDSEGKSRGQMIEPLYYKASVAARIDPEYHQFIALVDALRIGRSREQKIAIQELKKRFGLGK